MIHTAMRSVNNNEWTGTHPVKLGLIIKGTLRKRSQFYRQLPAISAHLPECELEVLESTYPGHALKLAARACPQSDFLIAVGGDGTLHEVLNGCMEALGENPELKLPVLGVLPLGSANDFARTLGISDSVEQLCQMLASRSVRRIDAGSLLCESIAGEAVQRYFLNVVDVGIGAEVVQRLEATGKRLGSRLSYLWATLVTFVRYRHVRLRVETDRGLDWLGPALILVAAKGRFFGSGLCIAPDAVIDDGTFALTLVGDASIIDFALNLGRLKKGVPLEHPQAEYHRAQWVTLEAPGGSAPVEADGEFIGYAPVRMEIRPGLVEFLVPARSEK
jgi:YegS/Rv2252/BmrU family lipid kinase